MSSTGLQTVPPTVPSGPRPWARRESDPACISRPLGETTDGARAGPAYEARPGPAYEDGKADAVGHRSPPSPASANPEKHFAPATSTPCPRIDSSNSYGPTP